MAAGDNPPQPADTLATLRRRSRPKRPIQTDLFAAPAPEKLAVQSHSAPVIRPVAAVVVSEERRVWTVRALVGDIRSHTESAYADIWVEGEISNCRLAASGHIYFTLKDGEAQLLVVLFRRQAQLLRFRPQDGLAALVRGRVSVYESRGQLQLIAETMEPRGAGALQIAFEQLKRRLAEEGLFDAARKRPLPAFPRSIGVVTSPTGAVIRDIVTVIRRRHGRLNLLIYPALMQGAASPASVVAGIAWFNARENAGRADAILIARGGGSLEDLAAFNDEALARAIAASGLPVVSAIGHETDFTIADFVADLRAPTPSAAAELITAAQHRIEERVEALEARLRRGIAFGLMQARQRYSRLAADSVLARIRDAMYRREQRLDDLQDRMDAAMARGLRTPAARLASLGGRLRQQAPLARLTAARRRLDRADEAQKRIADRLLIARRTRLARAATRLEGLSPLAVLRRGYAIVYLEDGGVLRSAAEASPGQRISARLEAGALTATVLETRMETRMETHG
jgi:exodeoxyribonuclease VII large subunit